MMVFSPQSFVRLQEKRIIYYQGSRYLAPAGTVGVVEYHQVTSGKQRGGVVRVVLDLEEYDYPSVLEWGENIELLEEP